MTMTNQMGSLAAGTVLRGNYEYQIVREIGRGAMAVVYLARQLNLDRLVALKLLSAELASNKEFVKRFFNEVRTAAALSHPHIIQAYDAGVAEGDVYYFAMEYVDGETLLNRVRSSGRLNTEVALEYGLEIAHALNYGWQRQRLTHGDIKPENIMVTADNQAKLADFGLAKVSGHDYEGSEVMLTPHYAAPELIAGELSKDDCRADIYAFGASLYHLLSGTTPYPGDNGQEVMQMHLNEPLEALKGRCPEVPGFVSDFIGSLMEKEAGLRPQSWQAVLTGLQVCQERLSKTREKLSSGRKVRLNLPAAERRGPVVPARAAGVSGGTAGDGSVAARTRQSSRANLLWMLAMLLGIVLLLVLGFLYMQKKNRGGAAVVEAGAETVAPASLPENAAPTLPGVAASSMATAAPSLNVSSVAAPVTTATAVPPATETAGAVDPQTAPVVPATPAAPVEAAEPPIVAAAEVAAGEVAAGEVVVVEPAGVLLPDYALPVPEGQELVAEQLDCLVLLQSLQVVPDRASSVEPLMRRVSEWQKGRSLSPAGAGLATFLREVAIPRLDEASSRLVMRKESLRGKTIQSTQAGQAVYRIHDVTVSGMLLDKEIGDKGYMRMELGWGRLAGERYLDSIYLQAFGDSSDVIDQQCLLSRMLFTGRSEMVEKLLVRQPALPERANWQVLAQMLQVLSQNPLAVSKFGELRQAMADGARSQAGRLADEILRMPNVLPEGRAWCQSILAASGGYVRDIRGGQLIREAGEYLENQPVEAYCRLLAAQNLCVGRYPERTALEASLRQCLERLAALGWPGAVGGQLPFAGWRPLLPLPVWGYLEAPPATERRERRSEAAAAAEVQGRALLNHVEAGNWLAGREAAAALASARLRRDDFAAEWQFPLAYAAFLLDLRYMDTLDRVLVFLRESPNYLPADATRPAAVARVLEGALFCRSRQALNALPGVMRQDPDPGLPPEESFRLACRLAVVHCESGSDGLLVGLWPLLRRGLPEGAAPLVDWLQAQQAHGDAAAALPALPERIDPELLLLLAALAPESGFQAGSDAWMLAQMRGAWRGWPLVGGEAVFTWLLRRLAAELRRGDVWTAQALVQQVAATEMPALTAYQSRLLLLRAGLLTLGGSSGGWLDAREGLRANGAASEGERQLPGRDLTVGKLPSGSPTGFYQGWLHYCRSLAMAAAGAAPAELSAADLLSAEAELGRALAAMPALLAAAPPRRLPVP